LTLRIEILVWIMSNAGRETERVLVNIFGKGSANEIKSLLEIGAIEMRYKGDTIIYEVAGKWEKRKN